MRTRAHAGRRAHIRTHGHTDTRTDIRTYIHTDIHTYRHTDRQDEINKNIRHSRTIKKHTKVTVYNFTQKLIFYIKQQQEQLILITSWDESRQQNCIYIQKLTHFMHTKHRILYRTTFRVKLTDIKKSTH